MAETIGGFWSVPHSQLYAEPTRLAALGLLDEEQEASGPAPAHLLASPTPGRAALDRWLAIADRRGHRAARPGAAQALLRRPGRRRRRAPASPRAPPTCTAGRLAGYEDAGRRPAAERRPAPAAILALAARYEDEAVAFWDAVAVDPDLA